MLKNAKSISTLFVCTGNICRSPTAEAIFRHKIKEKVPDFQGLIDSAGIHGYHIGESPDYRSVSVAQKNGISMEGLLARKVIPHDFERFNHIIAMDHGHLMLLESAKLAGSNASISLLMDYHPEYKSKDVPDPYYGSMRDFKHTYDLIALGIDAFIVHLMAQSR